jgi:DNA polymerase III subunit delta
LKLRPNQIKEHFAKGPLLPVYLLSGDEPLLMQEAADQIRTEARKAGITERELFLVENNFEWNHLLQAGNSMSLFGDRKLLEVRNEKGKFDDAAKKALATYCDNPNPDNILLLILPKIDKKTQSAKWFQQLETVGAFIQVWPVETAQLPQWIHQRMRGVGLEPTREAVQLLAERVEGNLLAAAQEVEKLILLRGEGPLDVRDIEEAVADHARYSLYDMVDEALQGNYSHAIKMLHFLRSSGTEPTVLLWALSKEIRTLAGMAQLIDNGLAPARALQEYKVWENRKPILQGALQRVPGRTFKHCLVEAARIDQAIKGLGQGDPWDGFTNLILWLAGKVKPGLMALDA